KWGEGEETRLGAPSIQREYEHVARVLEVIVFHWVQVASACLHREILFRADRVDDRCALQRRADVKTPQLLQLLIVVGDHPTVLQRREHHATRRGGHSGADLDVSHRLRQYLGVRHVIGGDLTVIEVTRVRPLLEFRPVEGAVPTLEGRGRAIPTGASLNAHSIGDLLYWIIGGRLIGDAAVPGRAGALYAVPAQWACFRHIDLHVELGIVFDRLAGLGVEALGPVEVVD